MTVKYTTARMAILLVYLSESNLRRYLTGPQTVAKEKAIQHRRSINKALVLVSGKKEGSTCSIVGMVYSLFF
jgi:hypothetical protein